VTVAIKKVTDDVAAAVSSAMEEARFRDFIPRAATVFLKVNLGWDLFIPGSVTNPAVFEGVVRTLRGHAKEIYVVESDQVLENIEKAYRQSRISEVARRLGVPWLNLSRGEKVTIHRPDNRVIKDVAIPEVLTRGLIVTLPVMKTHGKTVITASLKNQWGCIPKMRHMYHLCLDEAISDVNAVLNVRFSVVDGTIAMEGNGPKTGRPRELGIVGAGGDLVEVDSVCARLMGFDPREIPHLVEAEKRGLGKIGTRYVGDIIEPPEPFRPAGHNLVSKIELLLRRSPLKTIVFETPVFLAMVGGAKVYYYLFDLLRGRALRKKYRAHPLYGRYFEKPDD
jgi:uncharacterized protein (DUF362 family)